MPLTTSPTPGRRGGNASGRNSSTRPARIARTAQVEAEAERRRARTMARQQQTAERIAAATAEIAAQAAEATSSAAQLRDSMQRIAAGAAETSESTQQNLGIVTDVEQQIASQQLSAEMIDRLCGVLQQQLGQAVEDISGLLANVEAASRRQDASVIAIGELEQQAEEIGEIVKTVAHIADQTNLLALNAAIEAARARRHGKGVRGRCGRGTHPRRTQRAQRAADP